MNLNPSLTEPLLAERQAKYDRAEHRPGVKFLVVAVVVLCLINLLRIS